jgi:hypothetical protein
VSIKWRKKYHIIRIVPKSNRKIIEKEAILLTLTPAYILVNINKKWWG